MQIQLSYTYTVALLCQGTLWVHHLACSPRHSFRSCCDIDTQAESGVEPHTTLLPHRNGFTLVRIAIQPTGERLYISLQQNIFFVIFTFRV